MRNKVIKYTGIALVVIGVGVLSYHFVNNYFIARKESEILTAWETTPADIQVPEDTGETGEDSGDTDTLVKESKIIDPEKKVPFRITIPDIDVDWIVNNGTDLTTLRKGPGFYVSSVLPGEVGTTVICGHRTTYGAPFNRVDELEEGDEIILETEGNELFIYEVTGQKEVIPTDTSVLENTEYPSLILSTCSPKYFATRRLIIFARIKE
jgi:LPXTG-site transpeptidase (sortase) family protein